MCFLFYGVVYVKEKKALENAVTFKDINILLT